jgi:hypothetical protein
MRLWNLQFQLEALDLGALGDRYPARHRYLISRQAPVSSTEMFDESKCIIVGSMFNPFPCEPLE